MHRQNQALTEILTKFAQSGWDVVDGPAKAWLAESNPDRACTDALIAALEQADRECGSCGCEFDPLYKQALAQLRANEACPTA